MNIQKEYPKLQHLILYMECIAIYILQASTSYMRLINMIIDENTLNAQKAHLGAFHIWNHFIQTGHQWATSCPQLNESNSHKAKQWYKLFVLMVLLENGYMVHIVRGTIEIYTNMQHFIFKRILSKWMFGMIQTEWLVVKSEYGKTLLSGLLTITSKSTQLQIHKHS